MGKPSIAFATLKYGLNDKSLSDTLKVDSNEVKNLPAYINFKASKYDGNQGIAARGCGLGIQFDTKLYTIPESATLSDYKPTIGEALRQKLKDINNWWIK